MKIADAKKLKGMKMWEARKEAIFCVVKFYAYQVSKRRFVISLWDLANNINNYWNAPLFVNLDKLKKIAHKIHFKDDLTIKEFQHHKMFTRIKSTIRKFDCFELIEQKGPRGSWRNPEFLLFTGYLSELEENDGVVE